MKKTKDFKMIIEKYKFLIIFIIVLLICLFFLLQKNDGMYQNGIINTYYRVYTKENGWSKWSKNGLTAGDKDKNITGLEIKTKKGGIPIIYSYSGSIKKNSNNLKKNITGFRLLATYGILEDHSLCYRTYNKKNKWLDWNCDMEFSGNIDEPITAFEAKIIPKNVAKQDYLRNYNLNKYSSIGFEEVR